MKKIILYFCISSGLVGQSFSQKTDIKKEEKKDELSLSGLKFRSVGPAFTSGRISDFAVNPNNFNEYYVASASGGVWKTSNAGTTYEPIFDGQGSYSIGCVTIDPVHTNIVWVGTGENNNQRSVAYGDGIYKSEDWGKSWKNMGLKNSEHIGRIIVHPSNSDIVYVAAIGPLWKEGGDRGVYKTMDGGKNWIQVLKIDEHTGVNDIAMDGKNPEILYAAAYQRRRHTWTFISGGPGSGIYKTTDGGKNWEKANNGLPTVDMGRIGFTTTPANPDYVYAIVEAAKGEGGFYRTTNKAANWEKRSGHKTSGNYYSEIIADPKDAEKVYSMDTWMWVTTDGGKNFKTVGEKHKHVDNHAHWINPNNTNHQLSGCDGGIYETWDGCATWNYKSNLPVTQFYKVEVDNAEPFYNIYGGTQDNFSLGGPSRTRNESGIVNSDWFVTNGGDGFESQIDPKNQNIVYAQSQYGGLVRFDKATGENTGIQPKPGKGQKAYRWNWDAPLVASSHQEGRIYFCANYVFRSDDRGNNWTTISTDLTRQIDRNKLPVMGKVWGIDAVSKNESTSPFGAIIALAESPKNKELLYAGTDDGNVQVTTDGGKNWKKVSTFPGVPDMTYVNLITASQHDENVAYAAFNNHKRGDFKPYVYRSNDKGNTWTNISGNLPERGSTYAILEDHIDRDLLFAGTEFGMFFTIDGGKNWRQLKNGLPTIAVRDIAIQKRENDLVLGTFGRGFYVLDDYSPLRKLKDVESKDAFLFPVKDSWMYMENSPLGLRGKGFMGESFFRSDNPPVASVFTYFLKEDVKTLKEKRQETEDKLNKDKKDVFYPKYDSLKAEDVEEAPYLLFSIRNEKGELLRQLRAPAKKGVNRLNWDFRYPSANPVSLKKGSDENPFESPDVGQFALPGNYTVSMSKSVNGVITDLVGPEKFVVKLLPGTTLPSTDRPAMVAWQREASELQRAIQAANKTIGDVKDKQKLLREAIFSTSQPAKDWVGDLSSIEMKTRTMDEELNGDRIANRLDIDTPPSINDRLWSAIYDGWSTSSDPTGTMKEQLKLASESFATLLTDLKKLVDLDIKALEQKLEKAGAPYTPGRLPEWKSK